MLVAPPDEHDPLLIEQTAAGDRTNPTPSGRYNLVVIGGEAAGTAAALRMAALGGRAALIEQHPSGGDCPHYGCVPSKALASAARAVYQLSRGEHYGFHLPAAPQCDFPAIMQRMRRRRAQISRHDSGRRFEAQGVDVYSGHARFTGRDRIDVDGRELVFRRALIATGGRASLPSIPGIESIDCQTTETILSLTTLPRRLVVIGGGAVGCELAQVFRRFGSEVHLVDRRETLLTNEEPAAARLVQAQFEREGIHLHLGWTTQAAEKVGEVKGLVVERRGERKKLLVDAVLAASGRRPNIEDLGLESAGVLTTDQGVEVDDHLRTSNPAIYAAGEVCSSLEFTHAADAIARLCIRNALFFGHRRASHLVIPRCTHTDPEIAQVGLTTREASEQGISFDTYRVDLTEVEGAVVDGEDQGVATILTRRGTGQVLGATVVAEHASEMIGELGLAMTNGLPLPALAATIHCSPTQVELFQRIADNYSRTKLTPLVATLARKWLAWRR